MNLADQQRIYLQTIFDHFHEKAEWPTYRDVEQKLISIDRSIDIKEISESLPNGFANRFPFNDILDDPAILSIEAIRTCDNSEGDLADFIKTIQFCVDRYFSAQEKGIKPEVSGVDLMRQLSMPKLSVNKVGMLLEHETILYKSFTIHVNAEELDLPDGTIGWLTWKCTLDREIRRFDGITSTEDYLERRDKERITARQQITNQLKSFLGYMYRPPGSDDAQAGMATWIKNLTEPNVQTGAKLEVALLNALARLGVPTLFGGDVERVLPNTGETVHSGPETPIFDLVALNFGVSMIQPPTAVLISCKSTRNQPKDIEIRLLSDESVKVRNLLPGWQVFGALVNLGEPTSDDFNYRDDVRIWTQSDLRALLHAKEHRYVAQFLWTPPWHWKRDIEIMWWNTYRAHHRDVFPGE